MVLVNITEPTFTFKLGPLLVATFDGKSAPRTSALAFAGQHGAEITTLVAPPSNATQAGFQEIQTDPQKYAISFDGIHVTNKQVAGMQSRDCPIVVIADTERMEWIICHAGRAAISPLPVTHSLQTHGIINKAVTLLLSRGSRPEDLSAYITAGICKKCFVHDAKRDAHLLRPFNEHYGWAFDTETGWFDIKRIIVSQLMNRRISAKNIHQDNLCTKEHPGLASNRGGDGPDKNNHVTVHYAP
ncbi:laccase domain-containing protein [Patescibacteria group bacterium]|nr:laccase domain-containing protein [Patescibacteria group bacterium]